MSHIKISISTMLFLFVTDMLISQTLFEDAKGETNMFIGQAPFGWARFNTSDNSASIGYNRVRLVGFDRSAVQTSSFYGGDIKVKVKDGLGKVVNDKKLTPGFSINGNLGLQHLTKNGNMLAAYTRPQLAYTNYTYLDTLQIKSNDIKKWESAVMFHVNYQVNWADSTSGKESYLFLGISTGYKRANNYDQLDDGVYEALLDSTGNASIVTETEGKKGNYVGHNTMPVNVDIAWLPEIFEKNLFGINTYFRTNFFKEKNTSDLGIGVFLAQDGKPRNIIGGLAWQFNDISNKLDKDDSLIERSSIFFYVGFSIGAK
jgi:hypothetical protein